MESFGIKVSQVPCLASTTFPNNNNNNVYFKSLSYTNVLFKLEMNAQQNKIFWIVRWIKYLTPMDASKSGQVK